MHSCLKYIRWANRLALRQRTKRALILFTAARMGGCPCTGKDPFDCPQAFQPGLATAVVAGSARAKVAATTVRNVTRFIAGKIYRDRREPVMAGDARRMALRQGGEIVSVCLVRREAWSAIDRSTRKADLVHRIPANALATLAMTPAGT